MGLTPIGPPRPSTEAELKHRMRNRWSRLPWRRRDAHQACLTLIRKREVAVGYRAEFPSPGGLPAPVKPADPTYSLR